MSQTFFLLTFVQSKSVNNCSKRMASSLGIYDIRCPSPKNATKDFSTDFSSIGCQNRNREKEIPLFSKWNIVAFLHIRKRKKGPISYKIIRLN